MPGYGRNGNNSFAYLGVRATTPPQMIVNPRQPTNTDGIGFALGTQWMVPAPTNELWILTDASAGVFTWTKLDNGGVLPTLPNHSVALGTGVPGFNSTGPVATLGSPLVSNGVNADPTFGVASVSGGGTGLNTCAPYAVYAGGTTGEGPVQQVSGVGSAGQVLTSNGAGMLPTWQAGGSGGVGGPIAIQTFTTPGSGTYTPTAGMGSCIVEIVGGGGGGTVIAGGGAGGYSRKLYTADDIGISQPYTVGSGGAGSVISVDGITGGDTTFGAMSTLITATGGVGGNSGGGDGSGGTGSGGDLNIDGGTGSGTFAAASGELSQRTVWGSGSALAPIRFTPSDPSNSGSNGAPGIFPGGGGTSTWNGTTGGDGADGIVIFTEYGPYGILPPIASTTINKIYIDNLGAGTYTVPSNLIQAEVEVIGGGGASGLGGFIVPNLSSGYSGSGGGYSKKLYSSADLGASQPYFVGNGGIRGSIQISGSILINVVSATNGEDTTFGSGGTLITGGGGFADLSVANSSATGVAGGIGSGGNFNMNGGATMPSYITGAGETDLTQFMSGQSFYTPVHFISSVIGPDGIFPGGGATKASPGGLVGTFYGGNGGQGLIIITEYLSA